MERTKEYSEAVAEALEVLQMSKEEIINKIPIEVIQQMNKNKSKTYKTKFDVTKPIKESDISEKAKAILAFLYRDYICPEEERAEINRLLYENEQEEAKDSLGDIAKENEDKTDELETIKEDEEKIATETTIDINAGEQLDETKDSKEFVNVLPAQPKKKNLFRRMIESFFFYDDET